MKTPLRSLLLLTSLCFGLAPCSALAQRLQEPWRRWQENPVTVPLSFFATNIYAVSNSGLSITLADATLPAVGLGCDVATNSTAASAGLKPYKEYVCQIIATNLSQLDLQFDVSQPWSVLSLQRRLQRVPKNHKVMVNGGPTNTLTLVNTNGCVAFSNVCRVEIHKEFNPNWRIDDDSDVPDAAPGDGTWVSLGAGKSLFTNNCALAWNVSLGHLTNGNSAGRLGLREDDLLSGIYSPVAVFYGAKSDQVRAQVELVTDQTNGALRQVRSTQCFVDIVTTVTDREYEMRCYLPSNVATNKDANGVYTNITGNPFVVWWVQNPDNNASNRLFVIEKRNGVNSTNQIIYDSASTTATWTLKYGKGSEERVETRGVTFSTGATTNRIETVEIKYAGASSSAYKAKETYRVYPWGWELKETLTDPSGAAITQTFEYYEDSGDPFTYRQLKSITHSDGHWEKREYADSEATLQPPGALAYVLRPWEDAPSNPDSASHENAHVTEYRYGDAYYGLEDPRVISVMLQSYQQDETQYPFEVGLDGFKVLTPYASTASHSNYRRLFEAGEASNRSIGTHEVRYTAYSQMGWADKILWRDRYSTARDYFYYDHGTYNASTRVFTDSTNGPTWRETIIHGVSGPDATNWVQIDWDLGHEEEFTEFDVRVIPLQSWKETTVFSNAAPVLKEKYVCIGTNATNAALFSLVEQFVLKTDSLGHITNITRLDGANSAIQRVVYSADWKGANQVDGDLKLSESDEDGVQSDYTYDGLKRVVTMTKKGVAAAGGFPSQPDIVTTFTYDAYGRKLSQVTSASELSVTNAMTFDLSGRLVSATASNVFTTTVQYGTDTGFTVTETLPGNATRITSRYRDRRIKSVTGTAVVPAYHSYSNTLEAVLYNPDERIRQTDTIHYGTANSARWTLVGLDNAGRESMRATPGYWGTNIVAQMTFYERSAYPAHISATTTAYSSQTGSLVDSGSAPYSTLFDYDAYERPVAEGTQLDTAEGPGPGPAFLDNSLHRFIRTETFFTTNSSGHWFEVITNRTYLTDNDATSTILSVSKERLSGFSSATVKSEATSTDVNSNSMVVTVYVDRANKKLTQVADTVQSTLNATNITLNGLVQSQSTPTVAAPAQYGYDGLGRQTQVISPLVSLSGQMDGAERASEQGS